MSDNWNEPHRGILGAQELIAPNASLATTGGWEGIVSEQQAFSDQTETIRQTNLV
jgi:hypothetical protein